MMRRLSGGIGTMIPAAIAVLAIAGCAAKVMRRDPLTSGMAKEKLVSGVTTQGEVLEIFGAPNIITRDREGRESWAYERSRFTSSGRGGALALLGGGLPGPALVGGLAHVWGYEADSGSAMTTVVVHFDAEGRVAAFAVQESHF